MWLTKNLAQWESACVCPEAHKKKLAYTPTPYYIERGGGLVFFIIIHLLIIRLCRLKSEIHKKTDKKASEDEMLKMRETYEERLRRTEEENQAMDVCTSFPLVAKTKLMIKSAQVENQRIHNHFRNDFRTRTLRHPDK